MVHINQYLVDTMANQLLWRANRQVIEALHYILALVFRVLLPWVMEVSFSHCLMTTDGPVEILHVTTVAFNSELACLECVSSLKDRGQHLIAKMRGIQIYSQSGVVIKSSRVDCNLEDQI